MSQVTLTRNKIMAVRNKLTVTNYNVEITRNNVTITRTKITIIILLRSPNHMKQNQESLRAACKHSSHRAFFNIRY